MSDKGKAQGPKADAIKSNSPYESLQPGQKSGVQVTVSALLEAGAHFGHQADKWNPKMLPFLFGERNGVHIINLDVTQRKFDIARKFVVDRASLGGSILFVGTKLQARTIIEREAKRCGAFFVSSRWLGGTLTNYQTIKNSLDRMKKLEELLTAAEVPDTKVRLAKKEKLTISRELQKLDANIGGIRAMKKLPDVIFVVDICKEDLVINEARRLHIPVIALVDSNANPEVVDFAIPSNDDASRTIELFTAAFADAVIEGTEAYKARSPRQSESSQTNGEGGRRSKKEREVDVGRASPPPAT